jgi:DNA-binding MarR family transcriptional regulator
MPETEPTDQAATDQAATDQAATDQAAGLPSAADSDLSAAGPPNAAGLPSAADSDLSAAGPPNAAGPPSAADRDLSAAAMTIIRLFRTLERVDAGLTPQQYRMLKLVGAGGERSARLAHKLAVAKPTLTATADGLVGAGLLYRETEVTDRRVVRLRLTPAGHAAVDRADAVYSAWLRQLFDAAGDPTRLAGDFDQLDVAIDSLRGVGPARQATPGDPAAGPGRPASREPSEPPVNPDKASADACAPPSKRRPAIRRTV